MSSSRRAGAGSGSQVGSRSPRQRHVDVAVAQRGGAAQAETEPGRGRRVVGEQLQVQVGADAHGRARRGQRGEQPRGELADRGRGDRQAERRRRRGSRRSAARRPAGGRRRTAGPAGRDDRRSPGRPAAWPAPRAAPRSRPRPASAPARAAGPDETGSGGAERQRGHREPRVHLDPQRRCEVQAEHLFRGGGRATATVSSPLTIRRRRRPDRVEEIGPATRPWIRSRTPRGPPSVLRRGGDRARAGLDGDAAGGLVAFPAARRPATAEPRPRAGRWRPGP